LRSCDPNVADLLKTALLRVPASLATTRVLLGFGNLIHQATKLVALIRPHLAGLLLARTIRPKSETAAAAKRIGGLLPVKASLNNG
jgi:hypothetical protein